MMAWWYFFENLKLNTVKYLGLVLIFCLFLVIDICHKIIHLNARMDPKLTQVAIAEFNCRLHRIYDTADARKWITTLINSFASAFS